MALWENLHSGQNCCSSFTCDDDGDEGLNVTAGVATVAAFPPGLLAPTGPLPALAVALAPPAAGATARAVEAVGAVDADAAAAPPGGPFRPSILDLGG